jgi:outer membrane murein-binding lipoprotein Lpp
MKWKLLRRRMTVSAPRVTIRGQLPWPVRVLFAFVLLVAAAAAGVAIYEYGKEFAGPGRRELSAEIDRLNSQLRELKAERDRLAAVATAYEAQMKVERSAQEQLAAQVAQLETEANRLREDLDFFESLLPAGTGSRGVVIRSFRMQPDGEPNRMRYRLLVQQSGKPQRDFVGSVQMQVNFVQNGRNFTLLVPDPSVPEAARALDLVFRHYQRVEGTVTLPVGAVARSVLVRILAGGETQTQQTFML